MPGGRPRKPTHLKVVSGTAQKCRINPAEPDGTIGTPIAPPRLSPRGSEIFYQTCADMERMGTLSMEWADMIADYALAMEEIEVTSGIIEDLGRTYTTRTQTGDTMFRARPEVAMRSDAMRQAQRLRQDLGLGPAAKGRVSSASKKEENPFAALMGA